MIKQVQKVVEQNKFTKIIIESFQKRDGIIFTSERSSVELDDEVWTNLINREYKYKITLNITHYILNTNNILLQSLITECCTSNKIIQARRYVCWDCWHRLSTWIASKQNGFSMRICAKGIDISINIFPLYIKSPIYNLKTNNYIFIQKNRYLKQRWKMTRRK